MQNRDSILQHLQASRGTARQLAARMRVGTRTVYTDITRHRADLYVAAWEGRAPVYAVRLHKSDVDAPKPIPLTNAQKQARYRDNCKLKENTNVESPIPSTAG